MPAEKPWRTRIATASCVNPETTAKESCIEENTRSPIQILLRHPDSANTRLDTEEVSATGLKLAVLGPHLVKTRARLICQSKNFDALNVTRFRVGVGTLLLFFSS